MTAVARQLGCHENSLHAIFRKDKHKCIRCGAVPQQGRTMCATCLASDRARIKERRAARRHAGVCMECGGPRQSGSNFCAEHRGSALKRNAEYAQRQADKQPGAAGGGTPTNAQRTRRLREKYGQAAADRWNHADGKCEACGAKYGHTAIHLHHIDQNPTNNTFANFACLCFDCHRLVHLLLKSRDRAGLLAWYENAYATEPPPRPKP